MICKIADFIIEFKNPSKPVSDYLKDYAFDGVPQFCIEVSDEEIAHAHTLTKTSINDFQAEMTATYTKLLSWLPSFEAMFLHASLIEVHGQGVAFTALSGTGKSTHTLLWQKHLGDKLTIINGDKPIIRFEDSLPFGYGNPWNGKEGLGTNTKTPIKHLCFIERSDKNSCVKISAEEALQGIFNQIFIPKDSATALKTLELLDRLLKSVDVWVIKCNTDISAATTAYNTIFNEGNNET